MTTIMRSIILAFVFVFISVFSEMYKCEYGDDNIDSNYNFIDYNVELKAHLYNDCRDTSYSIFEYTDDSEDDGSINMYEDELPPHDWEELGICVSGIRCSGIKIYNRSCGAAYLVYGGEISECTEVCFNTSTMIYFSCESGEERDYYCYDSDDVCISVYSVLERSDGSLIQLKDLEVNDIVKTLNENNEIVETTVLDVIIHEPKPSRNLRKVHYKILSDEQMSKNKIGVLSITTNHYLYYHHPGPKNLDISVLVETIASEKNLKLAGDLTVGDLIVVKDDHEEPKVAEITSIEIDNIISKQLGAVYTSNGRYFADGVLVSDYSVSRRSEILDFVEIYLQKVFYKTLEFVSICTRGAIEGDFAKEWILKFVENVYYPVLRYIF